MAIKRRFRGYSRKKSIAGDAFAAFAAFAAFVEESDDEEEREKSSGGRSSAGAAFGKGRGGHNVAGSGKFGDMGFLKRMLGKAGIHVDGKNNSGQTELLLRAQLGDDDAIQLLIDSGMDAKDILGLSSLAQKALTGDMDAMRLLENRGFNLSGHKVDIDAGNGYTPVVYTTVYAEPEPSALQKALLSASEKIDRSLNAPKQESLMPAVPNFTLSKMPG